MAFAGCFFPEYTFDEAEPSGGTGGLGGSASTTKTATSSSMMQSTTGVGPASGGGGQGGMAPTEDCFTPGDEDGDQLEDCADSDCEPDVECVDPIPVGWGGLGYVAVFRGTAGSDPACPPGTEMVVYTGNADLSNTTAQCSTCGCASPSWQSCQFFEDLDGVKPGLQAIYPGNLTCGTFTAGTTLTVPSPWATNDCEPIGPLPGSQTCSGSPCNSFVDLAQARPNSGTCTPTGGAPTGADPVWDDAVKACRVVSNLAGCTAPQSCVPKPQGVYEPRICIGRPGVQSCPGPFTQAVPAFGDFDDTRDCTTCTCGSGTGGTCTLGVTLYSDANCTNAVGTGNSNTCLGLGGNPAIQSAQTTLVNGPTGGSCPSTGGGVPTGAVTEIDPTTFCCLP